MELFIKSHNLHSLMKSIIAANKAYATDFNVTYKLLSDASDIMIIADEHRFTQVITNILSNAAKFSLPNSFVDIDVQTDREFATISIQDYGKGIPLTFSDNIWNKFSQADASSTKEKGGTGLGLAISKSLIEAMNGNIYFKSEEKKGTIFFISIPRLQQQSTG